MERKIELLAPAGKKESLIAAIQNGADAVYLGGQSFSARASANNFSDEELAEAVSYAHFRDVKIYVTVNTILDEKEIESAIEYINYLYSIGVDGIIVQDLGLAKIIRDNFPEIELHASTQMTVNNLEGAKLLEKNGFSRVVLARETQLQEIELIHKNTNLQIEAFAHGALCVSVSGQCLMSSMIGGRSGNRGRCAQPCRKSYEIIKGDGKALKDSRAYLISPKDLFTLDHIDKLIEAGVDSIKIEGRMKRPEYVATVINSYRKAIDEKSIKGEERKLKQAFNRGFTKGLPFGAFGEEFINKERPDNKGIIVGKILSTKKRIADINFSEEINYGDVLEFTTPTGLKTLSIGEGYKKGKNSIKIPFKVEENSNISRIQNAKELEIAKESYQDDNKKKLVNIKFIGKIGKLPILEMFTSNFSVSVKGEGNIEIANKAPITEEKILNQLNRMGDTDFTIDGIEIDIDEGIFVPVSVLNSLRREAVEKLLEKYNKLNIREVVKVNIRKEPKSIEKTEVKISVSLNTKEQFENISIENIDRFYLRFLDKEIYKNLLKKNKEVYYRPEKILYHRDYKKILEELKFIELSGVMVDNIGGILAFEDYKRIGDIGLNIFNSHGIEFLNENGIEDTLLSPELTLSQIQDIKRRTDSKIETIGYGFIEVMTMKHCPFSLIKKCDANRNCETCNFRQGYSLRDEKNVDFRTKRINDHTIIYNSYPISMIDELERISNSGIDYLVLNFTIEENPQKIIDEFIRGLEGKKTNLNSELKEKWGNITHGHYFRGVE